MDLRRLIAILRTWWPLLVVTAILAGGAAFAVSSVSTKVYEARATLIVGTTLAGESPEYTDLLAAQRLARTYQDVATTKPILDAVIEKVGLSGSSEALARRIRADARNESSLLTIVAESADPEEAAAISNALADELLALSPRQLDLVEPAAVPNTPISPRPLVNTLLAVFVGVLGAAVLVFVAEYMNDSLKDSDAVREELDLPTLGGIVRMRGDRGRSELYRLVTLAYPRSPAAEAYRTLRTNIEFTSVDAPVRTLLVTSSVPAEGKTVTSANLAIAFAQTGQRVLLIDADLRKPGANRIFQVPNSRGLTTLLRTADLPLDAITQQTDEPNLRILTAGPVPPNPTELVGSQRMRSIVERAKGSYDLVIFDGPPLQVVADSSILSSFLDATLLVVDAVRSRRATVRHSKEALANAGARVVGVVLNRLPERAYPGYHSYYSSEQIGARQDTVEAPTAGRVSNRSTS